MMAGASMIVPTAPSRSASPIRTGACGGSFWPPARPPDFTSSLKPASPCNISDRRRRRTHACLLAEKTQVMARHHELLDFAGFHLADRLRSQLAQHVDVAESAIRAAVGEPFGAEKFYPLDAHGKRLEIGGFR